MNDAVKPAVSDEMVERAHQAYATTSTYPIVSANHRDALRAALSAAPQPPAEGGWVRVPEKPTPAMAYAAACAHYGKKLVDATGIEGISMTVNGIDYSFPRAFRKFWKGALSALPPAPANGGEQNGK